MCHAQGPHTVLSTFSSSASSDSLRCCSSCTALDMAALVRGVCPFRTVVRYVVLQPGYCNVLDIMDVIGPVIGPYDKRLTWKILMIIVGKGWCTS